MPPISVLIKPASGMCNMRCDYCFYCDETQKREQASYGMMTEQTLKNVIRKIVIPADGSCSIAFQGGEPTLCGLDFYEKVIFYVNKYNKKNIPISYALQTNGFAITDEWCEFFNENEFLLGLSIDGTEDTHNRFRHDHNGNKTYSRIVETSKLFDKHRVEYNLLTVVNSLTAENITSIYRDYKANGWMYWQFIPCLDPLMEERGGKEYSLSPKQYGTFLVELFDMWYRDWTKGTQPYIRQFENIISIILGFMPESCEQRGVCTVQNVVEADGGVYPCDFYALDEYLLGNFNNCSLSEIQKKGEEIGFCQRSIERSESCKACKWFFLCKGGCYRNIDGGKDNYFCEGFQMFFDKCYSRLNEISGHVAVRLSSQF